MPFTKDAAVLDKIKNGNKFTIFLKGSWTYKSGKKTLENFKNSLKNINFVFIDLSNLNNIDYFMAVCIYNELRKNKIEFEFINSNEKFKKVFALVKDKNIDFDYLPKKYSKNIFSQIGEAVYVGLQNLLNLATFLGEFFIKLLKIFIHPSKLRMKEISNHCKDAGIDAIFIVGLTSFLIGIVLAYIGSDMLAQFGASVYIIDIMGMLTVREIGPLIAAIVIAGRSASSFTAQIGVMKLTEEIDAMKTMGFDPFYFLTMPRVIAMIFIIPLIIFIADAIGIMGQMIVCDAYLDISFSDYLIRFKENVEIRHFLVGIFKAPFFGAIIAIIGCMRGFEVKGSTESIGKLTTISVVDAIFWVIAMDALFAVIFSELEI